MAAEALWNMGGSQFTPIPGAFTDGFRVSMIETTTPFGSAAVELLHWSVKAAAFEPEKQVITDIAHSKEFLAAPSPPWGSPWACDCMAAPSIITTSQP